ncbi:UNVERIFIED_CONTAM: hypothetical protein FKN15_020485 [Acipenser sinensis]
MQVYIQDDQLYTQVVNKGGKNKSKCKPKEDGDPVYAQVVIKEGKKKPIHDESVVYDEVKGKDKNNQQQDDSVVYVATPPHPDRGSTRYIAWALHQRGYNLLCISEGTTLVLEAVTAENIRVSVYGALGDSVHLHFNTTLNSSAEVQWKRGVNRIGVIKNNRMAFNNPYINRAEIFANGTLRLNRTQKNDSGDYSVDVFNTDGTNIFKGSMQVYIQEAVSQPVVHSTCLSHGEVLLVCTVDKGDNASFNWSLDGVPLNPSLAYFSAEEHVLILKKHVSGNLVCIATNQVSTNQSDSVIPNCSEAVSQPVVHSTCLSHGEGLLVCTVDKGDNASFNWSLDGVPLNPSLAYFSAEEHVLILKKHVSGNLVCIATNQVSTNQSDSVIPNCSVTAEDIRVSVYGALGDSVHLHLNTTLNSSVHVEWKRGDKPIGVFKNNRPGFKDPYINRTEIFANGTLRLNRTQKNDSGDYSVDVFNTDGTNIFKGSIQVYIQEAVSQPVVHSTCLSHGKVLLVCTVDKGDNASFNWSLDGVPLNTSLAYFSDEEHVVILKKHVSENAHSVITQNRSDEQQASLSTMIPETASTAIQGKYLYRKRVYRYERDQGHGGAGYIGHIRKRVYRYERDQGHGSAGYIEHIRKRVYRYERDQGHGGAGYIGPIRKEYIDMRETRAMAALDISNTSEKEYVDMRQTRAMVALDISDTSEKEYIDMRETRAMAALDISDTSEKEYIDMRETRAMAALDISDTSEKEYIDMRETRAMAALDISNTSEKEYIDMRETRAMAALDISDTSEKEYIDMRETRAMVALDISDTSEKEYIDMRETRAMVALDISDTSEKEYIDMRETRAMVALDISDTSEKEYVDMRQTRAMVALDISDTSEKEYVDMRETKAMAALDILNT